MGGKPLYDSEVGSKPTHLKSHTQIMGFAPQNPNSYFPWPHQQISPWAFLPFSHCTYHPQLVILVGCCLACCTPQSGGEAGPQRWCCGTFQLVGHSSLLQLGTLASSLGVLSSDILQYAITLGRYFKNLQILLVAVFSRDCSISPAITVLALPMQLDMLQAAAMNVR